MLHLPEAVETARRELAEKLEAGECLPETAFQELLEVEPTNRVALFELARVREQQGDLAGAEELCRRGLNAHPCDYRFPVYLSGLLAAQ